MRYPLSDVIDKRYVRSLTDKKLAGIDIGSRGSKGVLIYGGNIYTVMVSSGVCPGETGDKLLNILLKEAGAKCEEIESIVGTGYGRGVLDLGEGFEKKTEITCHGLGAHYLNTDTRTIIDIGGQDSKVIRIDPDSGKVINFVMNDKCAAGTGRFLEKIAIHLGLELEDLGDCALKATDPVSISSQCVVFAESEVISFKNQDKTKEDIAAGIHLASARRVCNLLKAVDVEEQVIFTGGVSNNTGMVWALEKMMGLKLGKTGLDATYAGALGAAVSAVAFR